MIPERLGEVIDSVVPSGVTHIGIVVTNVFGQYLVTEPNGHPYGVTATFNKVKVRPDERSNQTVERCLREQVGQGVLGVFPIPVVWSTSNSNSFYFAGMVENEGEPVRAQANPATWCDIREAEQRIGSSGNKESRRRDLGLLDAASEMCLSPYRRILLMVSELHRLGFERLRAPAYQYPLAWRCPIVPAYWTLRSHGGMYEDPYSQMEYWFGIKVCQHGYSSADGQFPFEWTDAVFATPRELALRFVRERREIACAGWGPDAGYARWFERVLELTKPNGLYYAFAEFQEPTGHLYTHMTRVDQVLLPPPGWAVEGELLGNGKVGSLSDEVDVNSLLRSAAAEAFKLMPEAVEEDTVAEMIQSVGTKYMKVFCDGTGGKGVQTSSPSGGIDEFVAKWTGTDADTPLERLLGGFATFISELLDVEAYAQSTGVEAEQWQPKADKIVDKYTMIFTGIVPPPETKE